MKTINLSIADIIRFLSGCFLTAAGLIVIGIPKQINGIMLGVGIAMIVLSLVKSLTAAYYRDHPAEERLSQIEDRDERTRQIREKAKARAFDLTMSVFPILFVMLILVDTPLWLTLLVVLVYSVGYASQFYWLGRYQQEM